MDPRLWLAAAMVLGTAAPLTAQSNPSAESSASAGRWRNVAEAPDSVENRTASHSEYSESSPVRTAGNQPPADGRPGSAPRLPAEQEPASSARIADNGTLPDSAGQVWRTYDISPYTLRVTSTERPEQAVIDWILRETGYEAWHSEPLGILSAGKRKLRVYHTPKMQAVVADMVERFVRHDADSRNFRLRVITLDQPNWRARVHKLLRPVKVQTPGVQAWLLAKEDAAVLLADLQRRPDYREHSSPHLLVANGQSTMVSTMQGRGYVCDIAPRPEVWPGFEPKMAEIDEGLAMEFSPLLSADGRMIDAAIKCEIAQVEKLVPVVIEMPSAAAPRQRSKVEVPQVTQFRFHERFRWPVDQVLLIGMGMVALPMPADGKSLVPGLPLPLPGSPPRADLLVLVETKAAANEAPRLGQRPRRTPGSYEGRY
jgi:hypothetical protein